MDIEKLPTDNLYKFISISGLMLVIIGIILSYSYLFKVEKIQMEVINKIKQESIDFGPLIAKEASVERKIDYLEMIAKKKYQLESLTFIDSSLSTGILVEIKPLKYEYENLLVQLESIQKDIETNKENKKLETEGLQLEQGKILKDSVYYYVLIYLGTIIFIVSIIFWYQKTQKVIDKKLKNDSNYDKLFDLKFQALKELNLIYFRSSPKKIFADMDKEETYNTVAFNQSSINEWIVNYLNRHSAIIDTSELKAIKELETISNNISFEIRLEDYSVSEKGIKLSTELIERLKSLCDNMKNKFDKEYN